MLGLGIGPSLRPKSGGLGLSSVALGLGDMHMASALALKALALALYSVASLTSLQNTTRCHN